MRALVTRPLEDAAPVADMLRARGLEPVIEPMLSIVALPAPALNLAGVQAIVFTSANGVRAFAGVNPARDLPVFAVGDATARAARDHGFASVASAGGDIEDLARLIEQKLDPEAGALLHAAGSNVAGDLAGRLSALGFAVRRVALYEARAAAALSPDLERTMRQGDIGLALFFSPRTAATFVTLVGQAGLDAACRGMAAVCLSPAVAKAAAGLPWREIRTALRPELPALVDEIDAALAGQG
jgi:uroporphyrinogen-III synthase